jgi:sulfite exporter TauE/SafE/copper chaperone CopZ
MGLAMTQQKAAARNVTTPAVKAQTVTPVTGMTCASCETRVSKAVSKIPGVVSVKASSTRGRVEISWTTSPKPDAVAAALTKCGYSVGKPRWFSTNVHVWDTFVVSAVVVGLLYAVANVSGLLTLSTGSGDLKTGGLLVVLLLGLAAGISTCMAMTGGLVLAVSAANVAHLARIQPDVVPSPLQRLRPIIMFITGRIIGFALLGAVLGAIGGSFTIPTPLLAGLMATVAVVMLILGLRLTEVSPRIAGWTPTLPAGLAQKLHLDDQANSGYSNARTAMLGAATFFLPCGFTQAAQLFALSTGSPIYAGAIMGAFAIGTAPGLLVLGGLPELLPTRHRTTLLRGLGVLVLGFALINASAAVRLSGVNVASLLPHAGGQVASTVSSNVTVSAKYQTIAMTQDGGGYSPSRSVVYSGVPIRWEVNSTDAQTCAAFLRAPGVGVAVSLNPGKNTIEIPAQQAGQINFSCSMGMYGGSISVIDKPAPAGGTTSSNSGPTS